MGKRRRAVSGPFSFVEALGATTGHRRRHRGLHLPGIHGHKGRGSVSRLLAGPLPKPLAKHIPSRRKRRHLLRDASSRIDRLSHMADNVATVVGVVAAGKGVLEATRSRRQEAEGQRNAVSARSGSDGAGDEEDFEEDDEGLEDPDDDEVIDEDDFDELDDQGVEADVEEEGGFGARDEGEDFDEDLDEDDEDLDDEEIDDSYAFEGEDGEEPETFNEEEDPDVPTDLEDAGVHRARNRSKTKRAS